MAFFQQISLAHLPTWMLIIGYPLCWVYVLCHNASDGHTSLLAWIVWIMIAAIVAYQQRHMKVCLPGFKQYTVFWVCGGVIGIIVGIAAYAASFPIHLMQESDAMYYHYMLPRQHLILGSFAHIPWSSFDLFPLPIQWALAPFWFATEYPNKWPQFIFFLGLLGVIYSILARHATERPWVIWLVVLSICASHGIGIQLGTAMMDIVLAYLFFACLDSLIKKQWVMASIEAGFLLWSKPMLVVGFGVIGIVVWFIHMVVKKTSYTTLFMPSLNITVGRQWLIGLMISSCCVGLPFVVKSWHYAATPFFPSMVGLWPGSQFDKASIHGQSIKNAAQSILTYTQDTYGVGRDLVSFLQHFWLIAVADKGVNNQFDYPLGLPLLLFLIPFLVFLYLDFKKKHIYWIDIGIIAMWALWWFSSQQSRFLYIPLLLMFISVSLKLEKPFKPLLIGLCFALCFNGISIARAHYADWGKSHHDVLRAEDQKLVAYHELQQSTPSQQFQQWPESDVAYAQFPVTVVGEKLPHTLTF